MTSMMPSSTTPPGYIVSFNDTKRGYVVEMLDPGNKRCESWLLLPAENLWHEAVRGFLYSLAMCYIFMGIAIASDMFMCSIEVITSKKRNVVRWDEEKQERVEKEVLVWNETVANLTLLALGSSAPEILLAVIETAQVMDVEEDADGLGTFTIIGSAAFNLLIITSICVMSVPSPGVKRIRELGVFGLTSVCSIWAYLWLLIVVIGPSPGVIEPWEAWLTLAYFPILVLLAYAQDCGWWCHKWKKSSSTVDTLASSQMNVRVITNDRRRNSIMHGPSKELATLEKEKTMLKSNANLKEDTKTNFSAEEDDVLIDNLPRPVTQTTDLEALTPRPTSVNQQQPPSLNSIQESSNDAEENGSQTKLVPAEASNKQHISRASNENSQSAGLRHSRSPNRFRFRHAAVRSLMGGKHRRHPHAQPHHQGADHAAQPTHKMPTQEELYGKFTFAAPSYSVLESAGVLEVDVLYHRKPPTKSSQSLMNGNTTGQTETSFTENGHGPDSHTVTVEYETREGSGKLDKDFKYANGTLVFKESEYRQSLSVTIINDNQYEADKDFYIFLKNPTGDGAIGDPNVTRVTIIDDDEPGEFQFEQPHYYADLQAGFVYATVLRRGGCDGTVTLEYSTIDGTGRGGDKLGSGVDYKCCRDGMLHFKHGETSSQIAVQVNKETKGSKNFIITLRNPSLGAKIGEHSATVANITRDNLAERIAGILDDDEEEVTWGGQFKNAMILEAEEDEDGNEIPLSCMDYVLHFLTFMWKVICACIPPRKYLGAWPSFVGSLAVIGGLTALVEQFGSLIGCVTGLKPSIAGITIIALGTSLPDTFASRTAALHDECADAAIGNITGSNSVNVFLGLGVPWVMKSMYLWAKGKTYRVATGNLVSSVVIFTIVGTICIIMLLIRRKVVGGELGGGKVSKYLCGLFLVVLWVTYILLSALKAYHKDLLPW